MTQNTQWVCQTEPECPCATDGPYTCECVTRIKGEAVGICMNCGALTVLIDADTGTLMRKETRRRYAPSRRRKGDWMTTYTGRQFWPLDPRPEEIDLRDIAHALAMICRFCGHSKDFYSVAEHSVRVMRVVEERCQHWDKEPLRQLMIAALLHDASEAYLMDVPRPLKRTTVFDEYRKCERRLEDVIGVRFGIAHGQYTPRGEHAETIDDIVKLADNALLVTELRDLMPPQPARPGDGQVGRNPSDALTERITPWIAYQAENRFLELAQHLGVE